MGVRQMARTWVSGGAIVDLDNEYWKVIKNDRKNSWYKADVR